MTGLDNRRRTAGPIFVVGSPRSGTTALGLALAAHPGLWASGESYVLHDLFGDAKPERAYERAVSNPSNGFLKAEAIDRPEFLASLGIGIDRLFASRSDGLRWIDHTPHHVYMASTLRAMFPDAMFVHIVRDGRRVVESMTHFLDPMDAERREALQAGHLPPWAADFGEACTSWTTSVEAGAAFAATNPERTVTVLHERMVADPAAALAAILERLGEPGHDGPATYLASTRVNSSFGPDVASGAPADPWDRWTSEQRETFESTAAAGFAVWQQLSGADHE